MESWNPAQLKDLKHALFAAKNDFDYTTEPLVAEMRKAKISKAAIVASLRVSAALALWLALTDKWSAMGHTVPEYKDATGVLRALVDAEAAGVTEQMSKAA